MLDFARAETAKKARNLRHPLLCLDAIQVGTAPHCTPHTCVMCACLLPARRCAVRDCGVAPARRLYCLRACGERVVQAQYGI